VAGFLSVYDYLSSDDKLLPNLNQGDILNIANFTARESFSRAKPRYTEASLVKKIEEMGIGRPSTFATMVSTVQDRGYVSKETREGVERAYQKIEIIKGAISESTPVESTGAEKNKLFPTSVAYLLNDMHRLCLNLATVCHLKIGNRTHLKIQGIPRLHR
jgi:DNA topoisomerase-1